MLDFFTIFSKGGILLWCFKGAGLLQEDLAKFRPTVNAFIRSVLLQEMTSKSMTYEEANNTLALKYRLDNEFELVFVAGYQKMLPLLYLDKLLDEIQLRFRDRYANELKKNNFLAVNFDASEFDGEFEKSLRRCEAESRVVEQKKKSEMRSYEDSAKSKKTVASMIENNNKDKEPPKSKAKELSIVQQASLQAENDNDNDAVLAARAKMQMKMAGGPGKKANKVKSPKAAKEGKKATKWDPFMFGGKGATGEEARELERGPKSPKAGKADSGSSEEEDRHYNKFVPDSSVIGKSDKIDTMDEEPSEDEDDLEELTKSSNSSSSGGLWSSLSSLVGNKALSRADIEPVISKMQDHLISKNVAADVAVKLCDSVANTLEGKVLGTFSSIHKTVKTALNDSLVKLLTPKRRIDIIRDVLEAKSHRRPYVVTFCGVNGVGKSTNLAKICFWLIENRFRVLIAACDTFRAGAVEQLRTHSKRLNNMHPPSENGGRPFVELYEKGYGKDAAGIALEAINYARNSQIDVVLVDTAGRMQDNEPLMRALSKLIAVNAPDLVLFVGEALVGNEAVDQLVKFNAALADHSSQADPHLIDGIVLTKFDTIDDKVGSAISMTYITGQPIIFVGTGQTYTDLKSINPRAVVQALMK